MKQKIEHPIYIVSKGRWENPLTAKAFIRDGVDFKILVELQEYENYCKTLPKKNVIALPFSNLGVGSYPARNFAWQHSIDNGHEKHWVFDDNIRHFVRLHKGKRINCDAVAAICAVEDFSKRYLNLAISGFNYRYFVTKETKKPFVLNTHVYSAMLIRNDIKFRWRLKYNEDVDLCLQVLNNKLCTVLFNAFLVEKMTTASKMKGGNQTELYKGNAHEKKVLKARSLEEIWPQYAKTVMRFNRPHHFVDWGKHFNHALIRDPNYNWSELQAVDNFGLTLKTK